MQRNTRAYISGLHLILGKVNRFSSDPSALFASLFSINIFHKKKKKKKYNAVD